MSDDAQILALKQKIEELEKETQRLRERNQFCEGVLDNLPIYLFVKDVDDDFRYLYWNKAFERFSKITRDKVLGHTDFEFFPSYDDAQKFRRDDLGVVASDKVINRHETYEAADGKMRIVQTVKHVMTSRDGKRLLIGLSLDLTGIETLEKKLVEERMRAESSDRLKSAFLANMSHEIRTPLNAIVGFSDLLIQSDDPDEQAMFSGIIKQNSEVLLQLINDILDMSKIEAGTLEYVHDRMDLDAILANIYEISKDRVQEGVTLVNESAHNTNHLILKEDQTRIAQIVTNLINNAIKFTHHGTITYGYRIKNDKIEVYVADTGDGIAPDKVRTVFDRFVKLDSGAPGSGLGLAISKMIVSLFGGEIWVESELGSGSTFRFTIPFVKDRKLNPWLSPETAVAPVEETSSQPPRKTILVAEDNQSNYMLLDVILRKQYRLVWAHDGEEAVKLFKAERPDIILMDMKMPVVDGLEAAQLIRSYNPKIPIIFISANAFESDRRKAREAGGNDFLTKPLLKKPLLDTINKYI